MNADIKTARNWFEQLLKRMPDAIPWNHFMNGIFRMVEDYKYLKIRKEQVFVNHFVCYNIDELISNLSRNKIITDGINGG